MTSQVFEILNGKFSPEEPLNIFNTVWECNPIFKKKPKGLAYNIFSARVVFDDPELNSATLFTRHGQAEGKIQESSRKFTKKVKRTIFQQAEQTLHQKYHLKIDGDGYSYTKDDVTNPNAPFPMLALQVTRDELFGVKSGVVYPAFVQGKYDGTRCLAVLNDGEGVELYSRKRNSNDHLVKIFEHDLGLLFSFLPTKSFVIDGELLSLKAFNISKGIGKSADGKSTTTEFQETTSIVRSRKSTAKAETDLVFCVFAIYDRANPLVSYSERRVLLSEAFRLAGKKVTKVFPAPDFEVSSPEDIIAIHQENVKDGKLEGTIIYSTAGHYLENRRGREIMKLKDFKDAEGVVTDVVPGAGKDATQAIFVVRVNLVKADGSDGASSETAEVRIRPAFDTPTREAWLIDRESILGKTVTYKFQDHTAKGKPRFPVVIGIRDYE